MGVKLSTPPDPRTPFEAPAWQTWFALLWRQFGPGDLGAFAVASLPSGALEGQKAWAKNGRKVGEGAGAGTGVPVYWSNGAWRVYSTDAAVSA
ncbi:hypothetical protein [Burkholderia seminalis]|uniref:hypothetical protein n=1 Tax=Burkholderia seminalis TaxID=488731 RepID=UPI000F5B085B|nr:hypothetical protein [Burkholderia seminalis]RQS79736.1 hypothetical protein DF032_14285 [Burkholderia seminalis]